jgi:hypothetical protein
VEYILSSLSPHFITTTFVRAFFPMTDQETHHSNVDIEMPRYEELSKAIREEEREIRNLRWEFFEKEERIYGYLSKQYPTTANPAPLGLCGFALTTFVLSMMNAGGLRCKYPRW